MAPKVSVDEAAQGLMVTLQALRAEGGPVSQNTCCLLEPHIACEAVVQADHDELIPLAIAWFRVNTQSSSGQ